jgi:hypothetical protein
MASAVVVDSLLPLKTVLNCSGMGCSFCRNTFEPLEKLASSSFNALMHLSSWTSKYSTKDEGVGVRHLENPGLGLNGISCCCRESVALDYSFKLLRDLEIECSLCRNTFEPSDQGL